MCVLGLRPLALVFLSVYIEGMFRTTPPTPPPPNVGLCWLYARIKGTEHTPWSARDGVGFRVQGVDASLQ